MSCKEHAGPVCSTFVVAMGGHHPDLPMFPVSLLWAVWPGVGMAEAQGQWLREDVWARCSWRGLGGIGSPARALSVALARKAVRRDEGVLVSVALHRIHGLVLRADSLSVLEITVLLSVSFLADLLLGVGVCRCSESIEIHTSISLRLLFFACVGF